LNAAIHDFIDAQHFESAPAFREISRNQLGVGDDVAHHDARHKLGMKVGLGKPRKEALAKLLMALGKQLAMKSVSEEDMISPLP